MSDWLVTPATEPARLVPHAERNEILLTNGLIERVFRTTPDFATVGYRNLITGATLLRGVKPEATVELDGRPYEVGGLKGQPDYGYLDPAWLDDLCASESAFRCVGWSVGEPQARYAWKPKRHAASIPWPPLGVALTIRFRPPDCLLPTYEGLGISLHYELYQGIPVLAKWLTISNGAERDVSVDAVATEILAINEQERTRFHVESDDAYGGIETTHWGPDLDYTSQVDYLYQMPLLMTSRYPLGPGVLLRSGETFESFRTFELLHDSDDRERRGLARRRMYRTLAPQVTENPILMHVRSSDSASVRLAIDQCAEVGFEMVIMTFWSGFDIESEDPDYLARVRADAEYAHSKGMDSLCSPLIELGGYTLMTASRDVGAEHNCVSPETGKPGSRFGQSACLASEWADGYFRRVLDFIAATGIDVIETDGPYHGDVCASTTHAHHRSLADSQWKQGQACVAFYHECRKRGIYINAPDWYYLNGSNKCAMGYRETNWSLPRWRQILLARQNLYDGTFEKTPSMGWMFVPLVEYHGGGAAATLEPLCERLEEYEWHLAQNFGSGVQACYRGPRLYDTEETKAVVKKWVAFYKKHRDILDSDIVHVRRADAQGWDCMMHVNSQLKERALAMVYNPTPHAVRDTLTLPLYYTGLTDRAAIREKDDAPRELHLDRAYRAHVSLAMEPRSITWFTVESSE